MLSFMLSSNKMDVKHIDKNGTSQIHLIPNLDFLDAYYALVECGVDFSQNIHDDKNNRTERGQTYT